MQEKTLRFTAPPCGWERKSRRLYLANKSSAGLCGTVVVTGGREGIAALSILSGQIDESSQCALACVKGHTVASTVYAHRCHCDTTNYRFESSGQLPGLCCCLPQVSVHGIFLAQPSMPKGRRSKGTKMLSVHRYLRLWTGSCRWKRH